MVVKSLLLFYSTDLLFCFPDDFKETQSVENQSMIYKASFDGEETPLTSTILTESSRPESESIDVFSNKEFRAMHYEICSV